ncbi:hypothetical protein FRC00_003833 [Tulasnella sp. 408]|nr:hypothetical protein FRC00_003833 [Tulasnella sp. 408]
MSQPSSSNTGPVPATVATENTNIDPRSDVQIAHNRTFSKQAGPLYSLPTDAEEYNRLDYQHEMFRLLLDDSLYPNPDVVNKALSAEANPTPSILDLGTGSGAWVLGGNPNFQDFKVQEFFIATGPWEEGITDKRRRLADIMNGNILRAIPSLAAGVRMHGKCPLDEIKRLEEGSLKEFCELPPSAHAYTKWVFATAVRTDSAWEARTQPWKLPAWFGSADHIIPPLPENL